MKRDRIERQYRKKVVTVETTAEAEEEAELGRKRGKPRGIATSNGKEHS